MRRTLLLLFVLVLLGGTFSAQQPSGLPQKGSGPGKPLSPQEAQKLFKLDEGLRIELVACEPQIESPVAMQFAPDGRLWVVEMRDYPNGPKKGEKPSGRIRILEDKDGDGFFETSTIWADNLLFANGLLLWKDGVLVTMAPTISHLRDTTGKGKMNVKEDWFQGFTEENPQLRVSFPIIGPDSWIYCANGLRGGKVVSVAPSAHAPASAKPIELSGMDFRFDPVNPTANYEAITGQGQFGNTFDEWGNRFVCDNRHHLRHVVMENRYIKRNPYLAAPALVQDTSILQDGPLSSGGKIYPISKNWTTSSLHEGRFTAACGVFIYHGQLLDTSTQRKQVRLYHGAAFTCDPTGNLVHMEILTPKGATFESQPHKKGVEFLASPDDWFRPVFLTHGPEGAMYVVDMYRAVIEHPQFMPPELKNRPDLTLGKDKGRIWRIVPKNHKTKTLRPGLSKSPIPQLVKTLEHAEPWWRQTAQRLLLEKNDKAMIEPLTKLLKETKSPHAKILAAWMLEGLRSLSRDQRWDLMLDPHPRVREHLIRIIEPILRDDKDHLLNCGVAQMVNDKDAKLVFQAALSLGSFTDRTQELSRILMRNHNDPWMRLAVQSASVSMTKIILAEYFSVFLQRQFKESVWVSTKEMANPTAQRAIRELAALAATGESLDECWSEFKNIYLFRDGVRIVEDPKQPGLAKNLTGILELQFFAGLADGLDRRGKTILSASTELNPKLRASYTKRVEALLSRLEKEVLNPAQESNVRLTAVRILSHAPWPTAKAALVPLVEKETNIELRIAALRALASQQDKEVPTLLMKLWPAATPSVRREILEAMLRQPLRVAILLDEIESKRMKASELDPLRTRQLVNHKDGPIRMRAQKLLANNLPADRAKVLAQYQAAVTMKGDALRGRDLFKKECAICHRVAGIGIDVGPDIADTRTKTLGALLNDILAPNSAIDANYVNYVVATKDGRILTGLLSAESASSITLVRAEKQIDVVLRKDIDEIASTGVSLMPEGFETKISVQQMADLLRFLKDWRYLDGSVPLR